MKQFRVFAIGGVVILAGTLFFLRPMVLAGLAAVAGVAALIAVLVWKRPSASFSFPKGLGKLVRALLNTAAIVAAAVLLVWWFGAPVLRWFEARPAPRGFVANDRCHWEGEVRICKLFSPGFAMAIMDIGPGGTVAITPPPDKPIILRQEAGDRSITRCTEWTGGSQPGAVIVESTAYNTQVSARKGRCPK